MKFGVSTFVWVSPFSSRTLELIGKVKSLGFDLIEICVEDPDAIEPGLVRERLDAAGLGATVCGAFGPGRDLSADDPAIREAGLAYLGRCIAVARALGSPFVSGPMYSAVGKTRLLEPQARAAQWRLAVESLRRAADDAGEAGVRLAVEPLNRFETDLVNTVEQGLALLDDIGRPNVGLLLDTFHMNIEERDIPAAIRRAAGRITEFHACANDRGTPGADHLPWAEIAGALREGGYDGPVVIEAFTPEIREIARAVSIWRPLAPSQDHLAARGLTHLRSVFAGD